MKIILTAILALLFNFGVNAQDRTKQPTNATIKTYYGQIKPLYFDETKGKRGKLFYYRTPSKRFYLRNKKY